MNRKQLAEQRLEVARAYRSLFLDDSGQIKPDANIVLRDLEKECGWMVKAMPTTKDGSIDPLRIAADQEKRRIYAHIKERLFAPLEHLKRALENDS